MVLSSGAELPSLVPRRMESTGAASTSRTVVAAIRYGHGRAWMRRVHRCHPLTRPPPWSNRTRRIRKRSSLPPKTASSAGRSVTAARRVAATVIALARPSADTNGIPMSMRLSSATMTVEPATRTERPAVDTAIGIESPGGWPVNMPSRCRVTISSA